MNGRDADALARTAGSLAAEGLRVATAPFDATDQPAVAAAVERIEAEEGPLSTSW